MVRALDREDAWRLAGLADVIAVVREAAEDATIAALVTRLADSQEAGRDLPLGEC